MTLAQRYTGSDTPLIGKQSVAAAHLQDAAHAADPKSIWQSIWGPFWDASWGLGGVLGGLGGFWAVLGCFGGPGRILD